MLGGGGGSSPAARQTARRADAPAKPAELPRGGRRLLPDYRVVAYYGAPQDDQLGALGIGSPATRSRGWSARPSATRARPAGAARARADRGRSRTRDPGDDGLYRTRQRDAVIRRYLRAARQAKALLILDIQPGRSDFFTETTRLRASGCASPTSASRSIPSGTCGRPGARAR